MSDESRKSDLQGGLRTRRQFLREGALGAVGFPLLLGAGKAAFSSSVPEGDGFQPFVIRLDIPPPEDRAGGLIAADLTGDGAMDLLVTIRGHVAAYSGTGKKLWIRQTDVRLSERSEANGLPGHHGPGVQAADVDGDGRIEVLFLTEGGFLHILDGATGREKDRARPPVPQGAERWEHLIVGNLRGRGDRDLILQATNAEGYRMGRFIAAYALDGLDTGPLWETDSYLGCAHGGARIADLDGDGRDEILGATVLSPEGRLLYRLPPYEGHLDAVHPAPVRPDIPGLQIVGLQEGGPEEVFLFNHERLIWRSHHRNQEPQNTAIGEFDPERPGLEMWFRSRYNENQQPWTFDASGNLVREYALSDVAPPGWTVRGVEVVTSIDWTGEPKQLVAGMERHREGDVCIFDAVTGKFLVHIRENADRLYVADVRGDWREELIALNGNELHIYENPAPNPRPDRPRLWEQPHYRRNKMTWNYYSV